MGASISDADRAITDWVVAHRAQPWTCFAYAVTVLGNTVTLGIIAVIAAVVFARGRHVAEAMLMLAGPVSGYLVMIGVKQLFSRPRPPHEDRLLQIESYSFPSGHAMMTMIVFGLLAVVICRLTGGMWMRRWVPAGAVLVSVFVGVTRIYLGLHWFSDALAGWILGVLWVGVCAAVFSSRASRDRA
ncbi:MAG: phosphatase PAP2 family protein [Gordonia sp. (in: high G+C Gram-positive bacteria)]